MNCKRCNGMMVLDVYPATQWTDYDATPYHRCIACGNCEDAVILHHRQHRPEVKVSMQGQGPRFKRVKRMDVEL